MANMRQYKLGRAKAYFLQNPEGSISQCARDADVSDRTAAQAHSELVAEGHLQKSRKSAPTDVFVGEESHDPLKTVVGGDILLTDQTMKHLAEGEMTDLLDLDDETVRKRLLKRVIGIALSPNSHPDSALSAATIWGKLKDMARIADLGPGKPMTRADAVERLSELMRAVGSDISMQAMYKAFDVKEPGNEGNVPAEPGEAPQGSAPVAGIAPDDTLPRTDEGASGPRQVG